MSPLHGCECQLTVILLLNPFDRCGPPCPPVNVVGLERDQCAYVDLELGLWLGPSGCILRPNPRGHLVPLCTTTAASGADSGPFQLSRLEHCPGRHDEVVRSDVLVDQDDVEGKQLSDHHQQQAAQEDVDPQRDPEVSHGRAHHVAVVELLPGALLRNDRLQQEVGARPELRRHVQQACPD